MNIAAKGEHGRETHTWAGAEGGGIRGVIGAHFLSERIGCHMQVSIGYAS